MNRLLRFSKIRILSGNTNLKAERFVATRQSCLSMPLPNEKPTCAVSFVLLFFLLVPKGNLQPLIYRSDMGKAATGLDHCMLLLPR